MIVNTCLCFVTTNVRFCAKPFSKLALKIFDKYANILKGMYSMRFNGRPADGGASTQTHSGPMRTHADPHHLPHSLAA
jgi:hypothetical protein